MTDNTSKRCNKCREEKPATPEFFYRSKALKGGLHTYCKICQDNSRRQWDINNREQARKTKRDWYAIPENKSKHAISMKGWYNRNIDVERVKRRDRSRLNPEARKIRNAISYSKNKQRALIKDANRRARELKANGKFGVADIRRLFREQDERCFYCGILLTNFEIDHFVPLTKGGTNWPDNLVLACRFCNRSKGPKLYEDWKATRGW